MSNTTISCIQPTGRLHIGNYLGAVKIWLAHQKDNKDCIFGIADLHSLSNSNHKPTDLRKLTNQLFVDLMACGLNLEDCSLFVQSLVPEHSELAWILGHVANFNTLLNVQLFKEYRENFAAENPKKQSDEFPIIKLNYPLLQAADILIYKANYVPIGLDQEPNVSFAIDLADQFNKKYKKEIFTIPQISKTKTPIIYSLKDPNLKMSKSSSEEHKINLFEDDDVIQSKIMNSYPDEKHQEKGMLNLIHILQGFNNSNFKKYNGDLKNKTLNIKRLKEEVIDTLIDFNKKLKSSRRNFESISQELLLSKLREESNEAREKASKNLSEIKENIGIKKLSYL